MQDNLNTDLRFSIIPEWVLDAKISDRAIRLYSILARYADNETLQAFPSRETLAKRAHCHIKSVDRAIQELIDIGAVLKAHRRNGDSYQSNLYTLKRVGTQQSLGRDRAVQGVGTGESPGRDTSVHLTRTTQLEPDNYIDKKTKRAQGVPEDWQPSDKVKADLEAKYPTLVIADEVEGFIDFHIAKGSVFKDFDRAFRNWCRNTVRWEKPRTVIHKQELKPPAEGPGKRAWVKALHDQGEHWECKPGEFGCK
jgi:hypothetical protein